MVRMTDLHVPTHPVRLVTASSLFDGHDASINIMRRILQTQGCEVIHLGHNRSVAEVVDAAVEEDVQGVAVSSYQGGHVEYFEYLVESLRERGAGHVKVVGGGGGVIVHDEIERLRASRRHDLLPRGRPADGPARDDQLGRPRAATSTCGRSGRSTPTPCSPATGRPSPGRSPASRPARVADADARPRSATPATRRARPGPRHHRHRRLGKSSLTDELVRRLRVDQQDKLRVAVLAVDPTRRKGGGALLGDRIRMNSLDLDGRARPRPRLLPQPRDPRRARAARPPRRRHRRRSRPPASTWSSSRRPASARATRRSSRSSTPASTS